jgi:SAM-dependent methyltransferase
MDQRLPPWGGFTMGIRGKMMTNRATAREIARKHLEMGDPLGWFEDLYSQANGNRSIIPWADMMPNPNVVDWLDRYPQAAAGKALKIGCGLGDDAEELARRGCETTAFDISESAILWCRRRYPESSVSYIIADLFSAPAEWEAKFDFVLESYTLQVLPPDLRAEAVRCIASFVAPGGTLLVIARGREPSEPEGNMPWPLTKEELSLFATHGLQEVSCEDYPDNEDPPVRRFRASYRSA